MAVHGSASSYRVLEVNPTALVLEGKVAIVKGGGRPRQSCEPAGMGASVEELAPDGELNLVLASARAAHLGAPSQRGRRRGERNPLSIVGCPSLHVSEGRNRIKCVTL